MVRKLTYLQYLPAFDAVVRNGSVRAAAQELNLSAGAVSLQLKKLSEALGIALFEKHGRLLKLTASGKAYSNAAAACLGQLTIAADSARKNHLDYVGEPLRVSVPPALGVSWLSAALIDFVAERQIGELLINEAITATDIDWEQNDIAIVYGAPPFTGMVSHLLHDVKLRTVCSPTLFPQLESQRQRRTLQGITLLHEDDGSEWSRWAVAARIDIQSSIHVRVASLAQAIAAATQGRGMALVSNALTKVHLKDGKLIQPFKTTTDAVGSYYVVYPAKTQIHTNSRQIKEDLAEFIKSKFQ